MNFRSRLKGWFDGCRHCRVDGIDGSLLDRFPDIRPLHSLKFGTLYQCSRCSQYWFLHENKQWLHRIPEEQFQWVEQWNNRPLEVDATILEGLAKIGGVENSGTETIAVPCAVEDHRGLRDEKGLVLFSKAPPFHWPERGRIRWGDTLNSVGPSRFALGLDIREASAKKREVNMGFAPVGLVDTGGTEYTLSGASDFFDRDGVTGPDLRLSGRQKKWRNIVPPEPPEAVYILDWFDGCRTRLLRDY